MSLQKCRRSLLAIGLVAGLTQWVAEAAQETENVGSAVAAVSGSLRGIALAPGGLPLADAGVVIRSLASGKERRALSNGAGVFTLDDLPLGSYEITAYKVGFASASPVAVEIAQNHVTETTIALVSDTRAQAIAPNTEPPLTDREKRLLDRIDRLEQRLAAMEARETAAPARAGSLEPVAPQAVVASAATTPPVAPLPIRPQVWQPSALPVAQPVQTAQAALPPNGSAPASSAAAPAVVAPAAVDNQTPFAFGDFTWLNGSPRNKDVVLDTPFFTPEIRFDTNFINDFNQPKDHTMGGSTEEFRNGEFQIEDIGIGGDFHWQNVRGRVMFMNGLFATTTPRNDASSPTGSAAGNTGGVGQWDLQNAFKYVSEAYGGYHFNVNHGLNVDAGIFVSYVGLFSYYNFDNWTYQPSYVSSNTPWFFEGVRVQWFPTNKLKIEPWIINGWQSYAKFNSHPGLGGQLLWMPKEWLKVVANQYSMGEDNLGLPNTQRIHTDDSIEVRYYNRPEKKGNGIDKMAFSFTADAGCQYGGGITCHGGPNKSSFIGAMAYDRIWWHHDLFGVTLGGGFMNNTGRYLTLLPPIDGAWAASGSVYLPELPGQKAHMWDSTVTFHYMPKQYITWWAEVGYRHSDIPYFSGRGGITPPGGNNGLPQYYTCMSGASANTADLTAATAACGGPGSVWFPDLRRSTSSLGFGVMVKF